MSHHLPEAQRLQQMLIQRDELLRYCAILVERLGGTVRIGPDDLDGERVLKKETIGIVGVVQLRTEKA